jgi:predicted ATPase
MVFLITGIKSLLSISLTISLARSWKKDIAQKGNLLIVDEPGLNLHPENQRKLDRLFTTLLNRSIKIFITTHSNYIIKELNTLILLNSEDQRLQTSRIVEQ